MNVKKFRLGAFGATFLLILSSLSVASSASASAVAPPSNPSPQGACNSSYYYYRITNTGTIFQQALGNDGAVAGQGGVTLAISTAHAYTVGGSVTGTTSAEAGVVFAQASASLGVTISASYSGTTTTGGQWQVPSDWVRGKLAIGAISQKFNWAYGHDTPNCTFIASKSGSGIGPKEKFFTFVHTRLYS